MISRVCPFPPLLKEIRGLIFVLHPPFPLTEIPRNPPHGRVQSLVLFGDTQAVSSLDTGQISTFPSFFPCFHGYVSVISVPSTWVNLRRGRHEYSPVELNVMIPPREAARHKPHSASHEPYGREMISSCSFF